MYRRSLHSFYSIAVLSTLVIAAACGDVAAPNSRHAPGASSLSGGSGGGGVTVTDPSILPTTPPAPDVLVRESFGMANQQRPAGGKGALRDVFAHTTLGGFWLEYPGSKNTQ